MRGISWIRDLPEVFALLSSIEDFLTGQSFLKFCGRGADFAIHVLVMLSGDFGQGLAGEMFAKVVASSGDYDLSNCASWDLRALGESIPSPISGMVDSNARRLKILQ